MDDYRLAAEASILSFCSRQWVPVAFLATNFQCFSNSMCGADVAERSTSLI
jgi:hypothetical protein